MARHGKIGWQTGSDTGGALGPGLPSRDLIVSPQHRVLGGEGGQLETIVNSPALIPAKALCVLPRVRFMNGKKKVTWVHFALRRHGLIWTNGCLTETLLLGKMVLRLLPDHDLDQLTQVFGAPDGDNALNGPPARTLLPVGKFRKIFEFGKHRPPHVGERDFHIASRATHLPLSQMSEP